MFGYDAFGEAGNYGQPHSSCNDSHGTSVTGIILMQHSNGIGGAGVAPGVYVTPIRIFRCGLPASDSQIGTALNYAWQLSGAQVVNNSWGGGAPSNAITNAINSGDVNGRSGKGTVFVFAAGNDSNRSSGYIAPILYPANLASTVAVGAINSTGGITNYSAEGSTLNLVAPSGHFIPTQWNPCVGDVVTTELTGWRGCNNGPGGNIDYTSTFSGTSAAAPQVAGVFSLLLAREPALTSAQAKSRVYAGADPWGVSTRFGRGKVNAYRALVGRLTASINGPGLVKDTGWHQWTAVTSGGVQTPTYLWEQSWNGGASWWPVGSGSSVSLWVGPGDSFDLRLTAVQGPDDQRAVALRYVAHRDLGNPCDPWIIC
jgi:serine protease